MPPDVESSHGWLVSVWLLVAAFLALALVESARVGIPLRDPGGAVFLSRIAISAGIFVPLALIDAWRRTDRGRRDRRTVLATLRLRWPRRRLVLAASGLLAYYLVYFSYHNLKSWDVLNSPRDTMLLAWDRWLFLGHSPAGPAPRPPRHPRRGVRPDGDLRVVLHAGHGRRRRVDGVPDPDP